MISQFDMSVLLCSRLLSRHKSKDQNNSDKYFYLRWLRPLQIDSGHRQMCDGVCQACPY